jgi:hypothetical protein
MTLMQLLHRMLTFRTEEQTSPTDIITNAQAALQLYDERNEQRGEISAEGRLHLRD